MKNIGLILLIVFVAVFTRDLSHTADMKVINGQASEIQELKSRDASWTAEWTEIQPILGTYESYKADAELYGQLVDVKKAHGRLNREISLWGVNPGYNGYARVLPLAEKLSEMGELVTLEREQIIALAKRDDPGDTLDRALNLKVK